MLHRRGQLRGVALESPRRLGHRLGLQSRGEPHQRAVSQTKAQVGPIRCPGRERQVLAPGPPHPAPRAQGQRVQPQPGSRRGMPSGPMDRVIQRGAVAGGLREEMEPSHAVGRQCHPGDPAAVGPDPDRCTVDRERRVARADRAIKECRILGLDPHAWRGVRHAEREWSLDVRRCRERRGRPRWSGLAAGRCGRSRRRGLVGRRAPRQQDGGEGGVSGRTHALQGTRWLRVTPRQR